MKSTKVLCAFFAAAIAAGAQTMRAPDITKTETLYVVPYAHLDTQWRWEFPQSISEYLLKTMRVNFDLIDKYPHYVFNWTGANRYRLMKEYFPHDYSKMKQYVDAGALVPGGLVDGRGRRQSAQRRSHHPPGALRQYLFPQGIRQGQRRVHAAGLLRISRRRCPASWRTPASRDSPRRSSHRRGSPRRKVGGPDSPEQTPEGIPFNVGLWQGTDGKTIIAALNPGGYGSTVTTDLSKEPPPPPPATRTRRADAGAGGVDRGSRIG